MPPKPTASAGCDTSIIFDVRNKHFKSKYTPILEYLVLFFQNFLEEYICPPKPLVINHRAALSLFHR